jgi:hypothetical protein
MKHLIIVASVAACLSGGNALFSTKASAAVNCSFDVCMKICTKNRSTPVGCGGYCTKTIQSRTVAGQCK